MIPETFEYKRSSDLDQTLDYLADAYGEAVVLAGGHSLIPQLKFRSQSPKLLIDISKIIGLSGIEFTESSIRIGATTRHCELLSHAELHREWPIFREIAKKIGDVQVRNRGTIGGSIACTLPTNEWLACLMVLDATIELQSRSGRRSVAANDWVTNHSTTVLKQDELIVAVVIPRNSTNIKGGYAKLPHPASGAAVAAVVAVASVQRGIINSVHIAATGVSASPFRASILEEALSGLPIDEIDINGISKLLTTGVSVLHDSYASASYRKHIAAVQSSKSLSECFNRLRG
jgi:carbon-monoxide dehydrogenase medium subunit